MTTYFLKTNISYHGLKEYKNENTIKISTNKKRQLLHVER